MGISSFAVVGGKLDLSSTDMLLCWEADNTTELALLHLESRRARSQDCGRHPAVEAFGAAPPPKAGFPWPGWPPTTTGCTGPSWNTQSGS